jgi:hypothetical protein
MKKWFLIAVMALMALPQVLPAQPGGPGGGRGPGPRRLMNPTSVAARLMLATPDQRQQILQKLPPGRREQLQRQLQWFDSLSKDEQAIQIRRIERFANLPAENRELVRKQMLALNQLPPGRRLLVRRALQTLQELPERQRANRMQSRAFQLRFTDEERKIITDLCDAWLLNP